MHNVIMPSEFTYQSKDICLQSERGEQIACPLNKTKIALICAIIGEYCASKLSQ